MPRATDPGKPERGINMQVINLELRHFFADAAATRDPAGIRQRRPCCAIRFKS